jgi:pimeloyl-ACP methyl ester carboxylesterase
MPRQRLRVSLVLAALATGLPFDASALDLRSTGVVLIHGKGGIGRNLSTLASALSAEGAKVVQPQMSWATRYNTYEETLGEVEAHVASLRARGVSQIVVIGHSLGANVALGYAARRPGLAAVVAIAPGHQPDRFARETGESLREARAMVAAGRGREVGNFVDVNQGEAFTISTTAAAYVSFFDPKGPAVIGRNAASLRGTPLLWVVGTADPGAQRAATGRGSRITVQADHRTTPIAGAGEVVRWLREL